MDVSRGSEWRKWDLHVHTPCSIVQQYGGDTPEVWESFLSDLESLPAEFRVIGINDYIFVDGYRRVLQERAKGRLQNIDLVLPVVELRLDKFGGSSGHLSRVNYHVIFSDEIDPDVIEQQFLSALSSKYQLSHDPKGRGISWSGVPTRSALSDLGERIIASVPEPLRHQFGSPLEEGFNNLNLSLPDLQEILERPYFKGKVLTAVGKTEWADVEWNNHTIADKKNVINSAHFVFTSAESPAAHGKGRAKLKAEQVNDRLLDCSDAHRFGDSPDKDRIGKCFTWIKADPTFRGLEQAFREFDERTFIGDMPPQLAAVRANPTKFIRSLSLAKAAGAKSTEHWFDGERIEFNPGLVAVIGNKGSGKSALLDILGLLGDAPRQSNASFLNKERFNKPKDLKGAHFEATLEWVSGAVERKLLSDTVDQTAVGRVKYIPQNFFEMVCNDLARPADGPFDSEVKDVIFSHVPLSDRLGKASLPDLIEYRTSEIERSLSVARSEVHRLNRVILALRAERLPAHKDALLKQLKVRDAEIAAHEATEPAAVPQPGDADDERTREVSAKIATARAALEGVNEEIQRNAARNKELTLLLETAGRAHDAAFNLEAETKGRIEGLAKLLTPLGVAVSEVISLAVNYEPIANKEGALRTEKLAVETALDEDTVGGLPKRRDGILRTIEELQAQLDDPGKRYEAYLKAHEVWEKGRALLIGAPDLPGTKLYIEAQIDRLSDLPLMLQQAQQERSDAVREVFAKLEAKKAIYTELYKPVQEFIANHAVAKDQFKLNFDVSITEVGFEDKLFSCISQNVNGSFCGSVPGRERLAGILERADFDTGRGVDAFLAEVEGSLLEDRRRTPADPVTIESQMRRGQAPEELLNFVFGLEYLKPRYRLQMAGKNLDQLSPGEKGSLLLVFYLLVDRQDVPLLIDQPEENLDNQTVVSLLVPSIKEAKRRRQIVIVTHNPNIAVVCDAEQIICATHDTNTKKIAYICGSMENPVPNRNVMDVLEGTKPAFDNRSSKYGDG